MNKVSAITTTEYDINIVKNAIDKHFENFNLQKIIKPDFKVLLKPNLLMKRKPELATTTHPIIVEAVILKLKELGVNDIILADSPGGPFTKTALNGIYSTTGMENIALKHNITLNYDCNFYEAKINGEVMNTVDVISVTKDVDFIINLSKLKTHAMTGLSAGVKNLFGTVPGLKKPELHFRYPDKNIFCNMLVDLANYIKPNFTIVDAIVSMEGDGPSSGELKRTNMTFSAINPFVLDRVMCDYIDIDFNDIYTVKNSIRRGLTPMNLNEIKIVGDGYKKILDFKKAASKNLDFSNYMPKFISKIFLPIIEKHLAPKPKVIMNKCVGCGKCAESCPAQIINITNKKALINYDKCIKCFCCHEMCPIKAIKIVRFKLWKW